MAKKKEEVDFDLDEGTVSEDNLTLIPVIESDEPINRRTYVKEHDAKNSSLINCLRNEIITVRHIPKQRGMISNPKHILYGGMADTAVRNFTVPKLSSGVFVNVLTNDEKEFLEEIMGLEFNALSIHKKVNNYWENRMVRLVKQDNMLDLSDPDNYIKYKILLANNNFIAQSLESLQNFPKATYQFVLISEGEETKAAKDTMSTTMRSYVEFGKIEEDVNTLRIIVETIEGKPTSPNVKLDFLQTKVNDLIQSDSKLFLKVVQDPYLPTKVLIKKSVEASLIANRGNFLYLREDNTPLCENNEEPTLNVAARYLNNPKRQKVRQMLEAKLKQ